VAGQAPGVVAGQMPETAAGQAAASARPLVRLTPVLDGSLAEWPAAAGATPWISDTLEERTAAGHRYFQAADEANWYFAAELPDARLDDPGEGWRWEGDALAAYVRPLTDPHTEDTTGLYFYPAAAKPFAAFWEDPVPGALVVTRTVNGGVTMEARIPRAALQDAVKAGAWNVALNYRDVSGVYETWWEGQVVLPAGLPGATRR